MNNALETYHAFARHAVKLNVLQNIILSTTMWLKYLTMLHHYDGLVKLFKRIFGY